MPRPGGARVQEKSKDFKGSMLRLFKNLKQWKYIMGISLVLAMISAILALVAPNKLSSFTDTITSGLTPNTEKLQEIGEKISVNLANADLANLPSILANANLSKEEQIDAMQIINALTQETEKEKALNLFLQLPDKVLENLIDDIQVDGKTITAKDQVAVIKLAKEMGNESGTEKALQLIDKLPKSVYNLIKPSINMDKIKELAIFMATLYLISSLFNYIQSYALTTVSNRFANSLRDKISKKINKLPLKYFDNHETGDVLSRVTNDVDTVAQNLNNSLATLVSSITLFIGSLLMMFITNWIMAITAILSSIVGF